MVDVVMKLEHALAVDEGFRKNTQHQNRSKGKVSKVFQRTIEFIAKGADIKWQRTKVYCPNGENIPRNFSSSAASGRNEADLKGQILPTPDLRIFSFSEMKTATKNFRVDRVLGEGGFGKVYKGWLKGKVYKGWLVEKNGSGLVVAVKKLDSEIMQGFDEWQSESYNAKIDFDLAKFGPSDSKRHLTTRVMVTSDYAAPEYVATGHLYVKSDVYGFGVVLVQMLTGLAIDPDRPHGKLNLIDWVKPYLAQERMLKHIMDCQLEGKYPSKAAFQIAQLALRCLEPKQKRRPSMKEVVETLERIDASNEKPRDRLQHRPPLPPKQERIQSYQLPQ